MAVVVVKNKLSKKDLDQALEDYSNYIKITIDIVREIVAIGGEYHADAEDILIKEHNCKQKDIWGGGYNTDTKAFETGAMINMRPFDENSSMEILESETRSKFLEIAKKALLNIESLL